MIQGPSYTAVQCSCLGENDPTRCTRSRDLHIQLYSVHAEDLVANVTQHVTGRHDLEP